MDLSVSDVHIDRGVEVTEPRKTMAELPTKKRNALPGDKFAMPAQRKYPVNDKAHADNAMARLEQMKKAGKVSPSAYASAKAKIRAAQSSFGEKPKKKKQLHVRADLAEGGSLHVRHMSDDTVDGGKVICYPGLVELSDKSGEGERVWIQLAKTGEFRGHSAGAFELNDKVFAEVIANFKASKNQAIPIDFEHASESDPTEGSIPTVGAPAQGWIHDLKMRDGNLFGLVSWGSLAREYIKSGQYKFFSPAIRFNSKDRVTGKPVGARMTSGALTNNPFLDGMLPMVARDFDSPIDAIANGEADRFGIDENARLVPMKTSSMCYSAHEYMPGIKAALKLPELCSAQNCKDALGALRDMHDMSDANGMHMGVKLGDYTAPLRDTMRMPMGSSMSDLFDMVEAMIDAAMDQHIEEYHSGDAEETHATAAAMAVEGITAGDDDGAGDNEDFDAAMSAREEKTMADEKVVQLKDTEIAELKLALSDKTSKFEKVVEENKALLTFKAEAQDRELSGEVEKAFNTYKHVRKLSDADREAMLITLKASPTVFRKQFPEVKEGERHLLNDNVSGPRATDARGPGQEDIVTLADKIQVAEPKLSRIDALCKAEIQLRG